MDDILHNIRSKLSWTPPQSIKSHLRPIDFFYTAHISSKIDDLNDFIASGGPMLVVGPPSSGKSILVEHCIAEFTKQYTDTFILRTNALKQQNPMVMLHDIITDLLSISAANDLGSKFEYTEDEEIDEEVTFMEWMSTLSVQKDNYTQMLKDIFQTIVEKTKKKIIIIIDNLEQCFKSKQVLLYILTNSLPKTKMISIITISSHIKAYTQLEKRVMSRFPNRQVLIPNINNPETLKNIMSNLLTVQTNTNHSDQNKCILWNNHIDSLIGSNSFNEFLKKLSWTSNLKTYLRIIVCNIITRKVYHCINIF